MRTLVTQTPRLEDRRARPVTWFERRIINVTRDTRSTTVAAATIATKTKIAIRSTFNHTALLDVNETATMGNMAQSAMAAELQRGSTRMRLGSTARRTTTAEIAITTGQRDSSGLPFRDTTVYGLGQSKRERSSNCCNLSA